MHGWPPRKLFSGLRPPSSRQLHYSSLSSRIKPLTALQSNTAWYQHFHSKNQSQSLNRGGSGSSTQYGCRVATANTRDETIVWPGVVQARVAKKRPSVQCFISHNPLRQQSWYPTGMTVSPMNTPDNQHSPPYCPSRSRLSKAFPLVTQLHCCQYAVFTSKKQTIYIYLQINTETIILLVTKCKHQSSKYARDWNDDTWRLTQHNAFYKPTRRQSTSDVATVVNKYRRPLDSSTSSSSSPLLISTELRLGEPIPATSDSYNKWWPILMIWQP